MVLVGDQAVLFWANRYRNVTELIALKEEAPLTSRDIDFTGSKETAKEVAARIGGHAQVPKRWESQINTAVVMYPDNDGNEHRIDFIQVPLGVEGSLEEFIGMGQPVITTSSASPVRFTAMHPFHVLRSRLTNIDRLPTHQGEHSLHQCRAAIICHREFVRETLTRHSPKDARNSNERLFQYLFAGATNIAAKSVWKTHGIDARKALLIDDALGEGFCNKRYPIMLKQLAKKWGEAG